MIASVEMDIVENRGPYAFRPRAAIHACGMLSNRRAAKSAPINTALHCTALTHR
jgi:hypothetical protein